MTSDGVVPGDLRFELRPGPGAPRTARQRVVAAVETCADVDLDVLALLTSELVTNVVLHADTSARVHLSVQPDSVRVEVSDDHPGQPELRRAAAGAVTGRGLQIVAALSDRWGVRREGPGRRKTVWFEVDRQEGDW